MEPLVKLHRAGGIARITLNRPDKLNAINVGLRDELLGVLEVVRTDPAVNVVLFDAVGRAFCTGQDLEERAPLLAGEKIDLGDALREGINRVVQAIAALEQPTIAAVQGPAVGAGASLAIATDIVLVNERAGFHFSFAHLGLVPDGGASWLLPRRIGDTRARNILLQGGRITAEEAANWGLAAEMVRTPDDLAGRADSVAAHLAALSPDTARACKRLLAQSAGNTLPQQLEAEAVAQSVVGRARFYLDKLTAFFGRRADR